MRGLIMSTFLLMATVVGVAGLLYAADAGEKPKAPVGASRPASRPASQPASQPAKLQVVMDTSLGEIVVELEPNRTPATVRNFLIYLDERFYDGLIFHRIMKGFMIQGGGITTDQRARVPNHPSVVNESRNGLSNTRGTIAMARTPDPNSATTQFFINLADNSRLDHYGGGYTAFGRVVEGMDVVDKIADVPVVPNAMGEPSQPTQDVVIKSIRRRK